MKKLLLLMLFLSVAAVAQGDRKYIHVQLQVNGNHLEDIYVDDPDQMTYQQGTIGRYTYRIFPLRCPDNSLEVKVELRNSEGLPFEFAFPVQSITQPKSSSWSISLEQHLRNHILKTTSPASRDISLKLACIAYCFQGSSNQQRPGIHRLKLYPAPLYAAIAFAY